MHAAPAVPRRSGRGGRAASRRPSAREIGGVREAGRVAAHDADAGAAVAARDELLDLASSNRALDDAPVLDEHLGEVAAAAQCVVQRAFENTLFDHVASVTACHILREGVVYRRSMPLRPVSSATVTLS